MKLEIPRNFIITCWADEKTRIGKMFGRKRNVEFPLLMSEEARLKREKREKLKNYILIWSTILIPTGLIWYAYFHSEMVAEFLGSNWRVARFKITFGLTAIVLLVWGAMRLFRKR